MIREIVVKKSAAVAKQIEIERTSRRFRRELNSLGAGNLDWVRDDRNLVEQAALSNRLRWRKRYAVALVGGLAIAATIFTVGERIGANSSNQQAAQTSMEPVNQPDQTVLNLARYCIAQGGPQTVAVSLPASQLPTFEALSSAVERSGKVPNNCPSIEFAARLSFDNQFTNPGLRPAPDFDVSQITQSSAGAFLITAPQSTHWSG